MRGDLPTPAPAIRAAADSITRQLAAIVAGLAGEHAIGGLVLRSAFRWGATRLRGAVGVGAAGIVLAGEVEPGAPVGAIAGGPLDGVPIATKAGAFGDDETLVRLFHRLHPESEGAPA